MREIFTRRKYLKNGSRKFSILEGILNFDPIWLRLRIQELIANLTSVVVSSVHADKYLFMGGKFFIREISRNTISFKPWLYRTDDFVSVPRILRGKWRYHRGRRWLGWKNSLPKFWRSSICNQSQGMLDQVSLLNYIINYHTWKNNTFLRIDSLCFPLTPRLQMCEIVTYRY